MKKTKKINLYIGLILFVILSNVFVTFYVTFFEGGFSKKYYFITHDSKYLFSISPYKNTDTEYLERKYNNFVKYKPEYKDKELYRTFIKNPLMYWHWYEYIFNKRYRYDYKKQPKNCIKYYEEINRIQKLKKESKNKSLLENN
ncbi:MAG: hypothetical protein ACERIH_09920 [Labilibaculum antarcticum]